MSTPYIGEIRLLPYSRGAPTGWLACDGSLQSIADYEILYTLLETVYGGDGTSNFGLPDLRGRVPIHQGVGRGLSQRSLGQAGGSETVTLQNNQMGAHNHNPVASSAVATNASPTNAILARASGGTFYNTAASQASPVAFPSTTLRPAGSTLAHDTTAPTQTLQYCIAVFGVFPAQS